MRRSQPDDQPLRSWLGRCGGASHVQVVHHLVEGTPGVVGKFHRARYGGVRDLSFPSGQTVDLAAALDRAEKDIVGIGLHEDLLQRARARIASAALSDADLAEPTDEGARRVLDRYMAAFESSDPAAIKRLLADDAVLEMTGTSTWFSGKATCERFITAQAIGRPGDWVMLPLRANGQLAAAAYYRGADQAYRAFAIVVLATTRTHLRRITLFGDPEFFERFSLPAEMAPGPSYEPNSRRDR